MRSPKLLSVIGTRPEAIKMAPVVRALEDRGGAEHRVVLTGQHDEMVHQVLSAFGIEPDYDLELMTPGQSLHDVGRACLDGLKDVAADFRPDATIVQGDTATVFFASVAAFFERSRLAHVEAGLRSGDKWAPFPEEMLRRMTDVLADYCFAPTPEAARNLKREGVPADRVFVTGNTVVDALRDMRARHRRVEDPRVARLTAGSSSRRLVLLTAHRRESFGAPLRAVFEAVKALASRFDDIEVLCPVHPNPRVRAPAEAVLGGIERVHLTHPLSYGDLLTVLDVASLVLTDSGGIQEEAPAFGTHALVLRDVTERPEAVRAGVATLVGTDPARILAEASRRLDRPGDERPRVSNPYGDGRAGERIADILLADLAGTPRETEDWAGP